MQKKTDVHDTNGYLCKWKLLAPKSPIPGMTDFTKSVRIYNDENLIISKPGECCTDSFIILGIFDTEFGVIAYKSYILSKPVQYLLLQTVVSQDVTRKNFCFVPDIQEYNEIYDDKDIINLLDISDSEWEIIDSKIK